MKASVVICTYNDNIFYFKKCIKSVINQDIRKKDYEILVVDMSTNENIRDVCKNEKAVTYFYFPKSSGLSESKNYGFKKSKGDVIIYLDADGVPVKKWIKEYLEFFQNFPEYSIVGGKITPLWESKPGLIFKNSKTIQTFYSILDYGDKVIETQRIFGGNCAIRREVFGKIGLFNRSFGRSKGKLLSGEETDFFGRASKKFRIAYSPKAVMAHLVKKERMKFGWIMKRSFYGGYSKALMSQKKPQPINKKNNFYDYLSFICIVPSYFLGYYYSKIKNYKKFT